MIKRFVAARLAYWPALDEVISFIFIFHGQRALTQLLRAWKLTAPTARAAHAAASSSSLEQANGKFFGGCFSASREL